MLINKMRSTTSLVLCLSLAMPMPVLAQETETQAEPPNCAAQEPVFPCVTANGIIVETAAELAAALGDGAAQTGQAEGAAEQPGEAAAPDTEAPATAAPPDAGGAAQETQETIEPAGAAPDIAEGAGQAPAEAGEPAAAPVEEGAQEAAGAAEMPEDSVTLPAEDAAPLAQEPAEEGAQPAPEAAPAGAEGAEETTAAPQEAAPENQAPPQSAEEAAPADIEANGNAEPGETAPAAAPEITGVPAGAEEGADNAAGNAAGQTAAETPDAAQAPQVPATGTEVETGVEAEAETGPAAGAEPAPETQPAPETEAATGTEAATETETATGTETETAGAETQGDAAAAAAAEDETPPADVEVTTEEVTKDEVRSATEDFENAIGANTAAQDNRSDSRDRSFERALALGLGAVAVGALLRNGEKVVSNSGDRVVVSQDNGDLRVLRDENVLLRQPGVQVQTETFPDGSTRSTVTRDDGSRVVSIRAADGRLLRRVSILPNDERVVLFDDTQPAAPVNVSALPPAQERAPVNVSSTNEAALRQALAAELASDVGRTFSLQQIRDIRQVRALAPQIELDAITFPTASAAIQPSQAQGLATLGLAIKDIVNRNPRAMFLVEGHTDAVGDAAYNLALSDRRAESVALALVEYFDVPPENLVTQGYGESALLIDTQEAERRNRRATVRNITDLLR